MAAGTWHPQISSNNTTDTYWTWYDNVGGSNWVLLANPAWAGNSSYTLSIGGRAMNLTNGGIVLPGRSIASIFPGVMGGLVKATRTSGSTGVLSQRVLWPRGGSSLEEVLGIDEARLSNDFWWTWYDEKSPGFKDWVLVSNPAGVNPGTVYYQVYFNIMACCCTASVYLNGSVATGAHGFAPIPVHHCTASVYLNGSVAPGASRNVTFPGFIGGPTELFACQVPFDSYGNCSKPASVLASQRVLSNGGSAFNEVPGTPDSELKSHYYWTWYDMTGSAKDWVVVANPSEVSAIYYEVKVAGKVKAWGNIYPVGNVTLTFPGTIGGPVEVTTWTDATKTTPARAIATQRSVFGPSFEEVPGLGSLSNTYNWTWYDNLSPGMTNWVLIANPGANSITATIKVGSSTMGTYNIPSGGKVTPTFPGKMGGPVEVTSTGGSVMASQRVLYNGYFNEVLGQ